MDFAEYRAIDAINFSALKSMRKSPLQFLHDLKNPKPDTTGRLLGRGAHTAILEPHRLQTDYHVFPGKTRRGKDWDAFVTAHGTEQILKKEEYNKLITVRDAVRNHPVASKYLANAKTEQTIQWTDSDTGLKCKARLDALTEIDGELAIIDLKGCRDVRLELFRIEAGKNGYHRQLGFYQQGVAATYNGVLPKCVIIAVEFNPPFDVGVFKVDEDSIYCGWSDCADWLKRVATCQTENRYPGCYDTEQEMTIRKWELDIPEDTTEDLGLDFDEEN